MSPPDKVITGAELRLRRRPVQTLSAHFVKEKKKNQGLAPFSRVALAKMERAHSLIQEGRLYDPYKVGTECPLAADGETACE